jgi:hypothetical protein
LRRTEEVRERQETQNGQVGIEEEEVALSHSSSSSSKDMKWCGLRASSN